MKKVNNKGTKGTRSAVVKNKLYDAAPEGNKGTKGKSENSS